MPQTITEGHRSTALRVASVDAEKRIVQAVIATESRVRVYDYRRGDLVEEVLLMSGADLPDQVPMLAEHRRALGAVIGSARTLRVDGSRLLAALHFADTEEADSVWPLVRDRHILDMSVGYSIDEAFEIEPGRASTVAGRQFKAGKLPLRVVTMWEPVEASIVVRGADQAAKIRSTPPPRRTQSMPTVTADPRSKLYPLVRDAIDHSSGNIRAASVCELALRHLGQAVPENDLETVRTAFANAAIADTFDAAIGASLQKGFALAPDTTRGWVREVELPNFRPAEAFTLSHGTRLERLPKGEKAASAEYALTGTNWSLARYARQFVVDEQDWVSDRLGAILFGVEQLGEAARRVKVDLVFALLLGNPTMPDDVALFHSTHANYGTGAGSAMGNAGLAAGLAAIAGQVITDESGDPIHLGLAGRYLVAPPPIVGPARQAARAIALDDGADIEVRAESRLSATGVVDPATDEGVTGSATNWLLAAPAAALPSIVVGGLNGPPVPRMRRFALEGHGQWGVGWDINLDIGAAAVDHRGVYFAAGE